MRFEHLIEINDPLNPLAEILSREQVWSGLMHRVDEPTLFLPGLTGWRADRARALLRHGQDS